MQVLLRINATYIGTVKFLLKSYSIIIEDIFSFNYKGLCINIYTAERLSKYYYPHTHRHREWTSSSSTVTLDLTATSKTRLYQKYFAGNNIFDMLKNLH